jgi:hypothetical protein
LNCAEGARRLQEEGTGETPLIALAPRRLPEPPAESEAPRDRQRPPVPAMIIPSSIP